MNRNQPNIQTASNGIQATGKNINEQFNYVQSPHHMVGGPEIAGAEEHSISQGIIGKAPQQSNNMLQLD